MTIEAIVVLPDHLHCLWRLPAGDDDFPTRWRLIKSRFSRQIPAGERISSSRARRAERGGLITRGVYEDDWAAPIHVVGLEFD